MLAGCQQRQSSIRSRSPQQTSAHLDNNHSMHLQSFRCHDFVTFQLVTEQICSRHTVNKDDSREIVDTQ